MLDVCLRGARPSATTVLRLAPALTLALALAACIGPDLDSVGDYGGGLSPFAAASAPERPRPVQVFIASTRKGETGEAQREQAAEPHYALATMTVPPGHHAGSIEEPLWGRPNGRNDIALAGERELDDDEFHAELASHISGRIGVNRDVLVFVHGFNTSFDEARLRATQIAADAHFGGVMVLFTWPSKWSSGYSAQFSERRRRIERRRVAAMLVARSEIERRAAAVTARGSSSLGRHREASGS